MKRLLLCALLCCAGCVGPAAERLIESECGAADAVVRDWGNMSEAERYAEMLDHRAGVYEIRYAVFGVPLPADLQERHDREAAGE